MAGLACDDLDALAHRALGVDGLIEGDASVLAATGPSDYMFFDAGRKRPPRRNRPGGSGGGPPSLVPGYGFGGLVAPQLPPVLPSPHGAAGLVAAVRPRVNDEDITLATDPTYCEIGDQSMVDKWIQQSQQRLNWSAWNGSPYQIAFSTPQYSATRHGGGTWKSWHRLSAFGQTAKFASMCYASLAACVGDLRWKIHTRLNGTPDWVKLVDIVIPEGHHASLMFTMYRPYPEEIWQQIINSVIPLPLNVLLGGSPLRFAAHDFRVEGDGGQHRYFVHFRRPFEGYDIFVDNVDNHPPHTMEDLLSLGLLPPGYGAAEPDPVPNDP